METNDLIFYLFERFTLFSSVAFFFVLTQFWLLKHLVLDIYLNFFYKVNEII
jgi:hypothetical protein